MLEKSGRTPIFNDKSLADHALKCCTWITLYFCLVQRITQFYIELPPVFSYLWWYQPRILYSGAEAKALYCYLRFPSSIDRNKTIYSRIFQPHVHYKPSGPLGTFLWRKMILFIYMKGPQVLQAITWNNLKMSWIQTKSHWIQTITIFVGPRPLADRQKHSKYFKHLEPCKMF